MTEIIHQYQYHCHTFVGPGVMGDCEEFPSCGDDGRLNNNYLAMDVYFKKEPGHRSDDHLKISWKEFVELGRPRTIEKKISTT